jgi:hypothetical protein
LLLLLCVGWLLKPLFLPMIRTTMGLSLLLLLLLLDAPEVLASPAVRSCAASAAGG